MIKVNLNEDTVLDMLIDRLDFWHPDQEIVDLYKQMYKNYIDGGIFECMEEFDPICIVDNDYINYCRVIEEGEEDYNEIKSIYEKEGCCDISCETSFGFIEATNEDKTLFLVRRK